jgi:hypothetical protein
MPQSHRYDQHGQLLSDAEFIQRVAPARRSGGEAVAANVIAHYECGFTKDDLLDRRLFGGKVGVTPEGCIVATTKTYFETPIPNRLSPEEFQRLGNTLASLLDSIDAKQVDAATLARIKRENNVEHKKQAIEKAKAGG